MNTKYYEMISDRELLISFVDQKKQELGVKQLTHEQLNKIQNEFLEVCRKQSETSDE